MKLSTLRLGVEAALTSVLVRTGLRCRGLSWTTRVVYGQLKHPSDAQHATMPDAVVVQQVVRALGDGRPFHFTCLPRSLTVVAMLRRRGMTADLRIGVSGNGGFSAHAWAELNGSAIGEHVSDYQATDRQRTLDLAFAHGGVR